MDTPERTMLTATGMGAGGGAVGAAGGTMLATLVAGGLGFIMGSCSAWRVARRPAT